MTYMVTYGISQPQSCNGWTLCARERTDRASSSVL